MKAQEITVVAAHEGVQRTVHTRLNADGTRDTSLGSLDIADCMISDGRGIWGSQLWRLGLGDQERIVKLRPIAGQVIREVNFHRIGIDHAALHQCRRIKDRRGKEWELVRGTFPSPQEKVLRGELLEFSGTFVDDKGRQWGSAVRLPKKITADIETRTEQSRVARTLTATYENGHALCVKEDANGVVAVDAGGLALGHFYIRAQDKKQWRVGFSDHDVAGHLDLPPKTWIRNTVLHRAVIEDPVLLVCKRIRDHARSFLSIREWECVEGEYPTKEETQLRGDALVTNDGLQFFERDAAGTVLRKWVEADDPLPGHWDHDPMYQHLSKLAEQIRLRPRHP